MEDLKDMERRVKARHFAWMPTAAGQLLDKLALLKAKVEGSLAGMILSETKTLEDEVSDLVLQLEPRRPGMHGLYVPMQRQVFARGYRPAKFQVMPDDDDEWSEAFYQLEQPLAELARITIAIPDEYVCRFETTAYWAETGVPARHWDRRSDGDQQDQLYKWEAKEGLVDPAEAICKSDLLGALSAWQAFVADAVTHYHVPPEWAPACVATQLREVGADFDLYRYALLDVEQAVAAFDGLRHVRDLQGKHAQTWRAHAILLGAYHRRLAAHIQEVRGTAECLAGDLSEYPRSETLSWIQRANKVLNALEHEIEKRQKAIWDVIDPREGCGYYPAHFDGSYGKRFRDWYAPLNREIHEIANHFIAAVEPPEPAMAKYGLEHTGEDKSHQSKESWGMAAATPAYPMEPGPNFLTFRWGKQRFHFAKGNQAESVRVLWEEWGKGGHMVSEMTIGDRIGSQATRFRLSDVFRRGKKMHPAWGTLIVSPQKGCFLLENPPA